MEALSTDQGYTNHFTFKSRLWPTGMAIFRPLQHVATLLSGTSPHGVVPSIGTLFGLGLLSK
jgi:hypothetical protein